MVLHRIEERQFALEASIMGNTITPAQEKEANAIDNIMTQLMIQAEKHCRPLRMGAVAFSDATEVPRRQIRFWRLALRRRNGIHVNSRKWTRMKLRAKVFEPTRVLSKEDIVARYRQAWKDYWKAKPHAQSSRESFIDTFDEPYRTRLKQNEESRRKGRKAKEVTGKMDGGSVHQCLVKDPQDPTGTRRILKNTKNGLEDAIIPASKAKHRQCVKTDFMVHPLQPQFGYSGNDWAIDQVLNGTFGIPVGTSPAAAGLIKVMQRPATFRPNSPTCHYITTSDHILSWARAKERTSGGLSGLHFGLFKANAKVLRIAAVQASQRNICFVTGMVLDRWTYCLDAILLKKVGNYNLEKLRTVVMLEPDFNMNNKKIGKDAMWNGTRCGIVSRENYGGKKHARAPEVILNQVLVCDKMRADHRPAIIISNDAKGCFDRIVHSVLKICML